MVVSRGVLVALVHVRRTWTDRHRPPAALLTPFVPTDAGWPDFMRVHPILDWTYDEIWDFLRSTDLKLGEGNIEWCDLYDYGYVSNVEGRLRR